MKTDDTLNSTKMAEEICSVQPLDLELLRNLWRAMYPPLPTINIALEEDVPVRGIIMKWRLRNNTDIPRN